MYSNIFDWGLQCCLCLKNLLHDVIHLEHKMLYEIHIAALSTCDMHRLLGWEQFATAVLGCQSLGSLQLDQIRCSYSLSYKAMLVRTIIQVSQKYIFCWKILERALVLPTSPPYFTTALKNKQVWHFLSFWEKPNMWKFWRKISKEKLQRNHFIFDDMKEYNPKVKQSNDIFRFIFVK